MTSAFDNSEDSFCVLINDEGQHSLWPTFIPVPVGWTAVLCDATRPVCQNYINIHWADLRSASVAGKSGPK